MRWVEFTTCTDVLRGSLGITEFKNLLGKFLSLMVRQERVSTYSVQASFLGLCKVMNVNEQNLCNVGFMLRVQHLTPSGNVLKIL